MASTLGASSWLEAVGGLDDFELDDPADVGAGASDVAEGLVVDSGGDVSVSSSPVCAPPVLTTSPGGADVTEPVDVEVVVDAEPEFAVTVSPLDCVGIDCEGV